MTAKTDFHSAVENATNDSPEIQVKYATYLKALKNADDNESVAKILIYINRYLCAEYSDELAFLVKVKTFCEYATIYIAEESTDAQRKAAHKNIMSSFADNTLFYTLKRTSTVIATSFTTGTNNDETRFAVIRESENIADDGENATLV
jgi:hypothetical protein